MTDPNRLHAIKTEYINEGLACLLGEDDIRWLVTQAEKAHLQQVQPTAIWQDSQHARWMIPVASDNDPNDPTNPWMGWFDVDANDPPGFIDVAGVKLAPDEARALARGLCSAADHVETFGQQQAVALRNLTEPGAWPEIRDQPPEIQFIARQAVQAAADRIAAEARQAATNPDGTS